VKARPLCLPCTVRAAYDMASRATGDGELQARVILETVRWLADRGAGYSEGPPSALHTEVCRIARRITGNPDPFSSLKSLSNERALEVLPLLEGEARGLEKPEVFRLAVRAAICGNALDFEVEGYRFSLEDFRPHLLGCLGQGLAVDDTGELMSLLAGSRKVLYLLDNAGEIAFDRFLIQVARENYPCEVVAAVKEGPVLNDATMEDARQVGLDRVAPVITTGNDCIGLHLEGSSERFRAHLEAADLIIAKGQGYYESMSERRQAAPVCYLLRAKCAPVAEDLGVPLGGNVAKVVH